VDTYTSFGTVRFDMALAHLAQPTHFVEVGMVMAQQEH
jgi:hypothetical protein